MVPVNAVLVEAGQSGQIVFLVMHVGVDLKISGIKHHRIFWMNNKRLARVGVRPVRAFYNIGVSSYL